MITTKQRAILRKNANRMDTIFQVGKGGIDDTFITQVSDALAAREMIKLRVLDNSAFTAREAATEIAAKIEDCDIVQVIGTRFVLFKRNEKAPVFSGELN